MNLKNFVKTKQEMSVNEFNKKGIEHFEESVVEDCGIKSVLVYDKYYYILKHNDNDYSLVVGRDDYVSQDLHILEKELFNYITENC
jgi:hypothetical protein